MLAKRLLVLFAALLLVLPAAPASAQSETRTQVETLAQFYAQYYGVPLELVRRVINRESTFNPAARNGPYYGLMQILPATARAMGFRGQPSDLLNAETNLIYAVKYLRGAWLLANGSHDRAVQLYAKGYYYEAKAAGLLEETGLRPGPATPVAPAPPQAGAPVVIAAAPAPLPAAAEVDPIIVAAIEPDPAPSATPLGFLPPARPLDLVAEIEPPAQQAEALDAIAAAEAPVVTEPPVALAMVRAEALSTAAPARAEVEAPVALRPSVDLVSSTFDLLDSVAAP